jgi:class 3 adenylate cyclase
LKLGGEIREVTFLVSDLRGFSTMASHLDPHTVITIINHYLEHMIEIILRYRGVVDEFQGDGILAFFGAPLAADDDPERAVACALEMQRAMLKINVEQRQRSLPELAMGIGINIGQVLVGNIGSEQRTKYGAMGAPINTAYRIESYTVGGQILASQTLYERIQPLIQIRETMTVQFKGVDHPVTLYDVWGLSGRYQLTLPEKAPDMLTTLETPLPVACYPVHGKAVAETALLGYITELAEASAKMTLAGCLEVHTNLKITLTPPDNGKQLEAYAKVVGLDPTAADTTQSSVALAFTSVTAETRAFLEQQRMAVLQAGQKRGL